MLFRIALSLLSLYGCSDEERALPPRDAGVDANEASDVPVVVDAADSLDAAGAGEAGKDASEAADGDVAGTQDVNDAGDAFVDAGEGESRVRPYARLPFCSGRNVFLIQENRGVGFCGANPVRLYSFSLPEGEAVAEGQVLLDLPAQIGGRDVLPATIRPGGPGKILLPMLNPDPRRETAATFLMVDVSAAAFVGPQVNATGLQIGTFPMGEPVPINGLTDFSWIDGNFWGLLSNPNEDGSYRRGFGIAIPPTEEGLVGVGVEPDAEGVVDNILSNRSEELEEEGGRHFSFRTTHKRPTNLADLGEGLVAIQNSGTDEEPASIDIASCETYQLLPGRNISLGLRTLISLPVLPLDSANRKAYPADGQNLWEVDLREDAPRVQENRIALGDALEGEITGVVILRGGVAAVGDSAGQVLFVSPAGPSRGEVLLTTVAGRGLTHLALNPEGNLLAAVTAGPEDETPQIVAISGLQ